MPRAARSFEPGAVYHLTAHGIDDRPIVRDDIDRDTFLSLLIRAQRRHDWRFYAICLLDTHYRLVLSSKSGAISDGMRELNGGHSRLFNTPHVRRGALFEARYTERYVRDDAHLLRAIRYVALNPVRAGLVARPEDWRWSTYGQLIGEAPPWPCFAPVLVLAHFGRTRQSAIQTVREFIEEALVADRV